MLEITNETQGTVTKELIESTDSQATFLLSWSDGKEVQAAKVTKTKSLEDIVRETITNPSSKENMIATTEAMIKQNQGKTDERDALRQIQAIETQKRQAVEKKRNTETVEWIKKLDPQKTKQCEFCDANYFSYQELLKHGINRHNLDSNICINKAIRHKAGSTFEEKEAYLTAESKAYEEWLNLTEHIERPVPQAEYYWKCKICNSHSESKAEVLCTEDKVEHLKKHFQNKYCEICKLEFKYYNTMMVHMNDLHEIYFSIPCELCTFITSNYHKLKEHMAESHPNQAGQFPLALSSSENSEHGYSANPFIERLWKTQIEDRRRAFEVLDYRCFICNLDFLTKKHAHFHFDMEHQRSGKKPGFHLKRTTCRLCELKFYSASQCLDHMKDEHQVEMQFTCEDCFEVFPKHSELVEHRFVAHGKGPKHKCQYCSLRLGRKDDHTTHENRCKTGWKYEDQGSITYTSFISQKAGIENTAKKPKLTEETKKPKVLLLKKIKVNNDPLYGMRNIQCYICGQENLLVSKLEEHVQTQHPEMLPYLKQSKGVFGPARMLNDQCQQCKQVCESAQHKNLHQCGKPHPQWLGISIDSVFKCEVCGDANAGYYHYLWHMALFHDEEKLNWVGRTDYMKGQVKECKKCEFSSEDYSEFRSHMRNIHGPRVRCTYCDKHVLKSGLNTHIKRKHEIEMHGCDKCGKKFAILNKLKMHMLAVHDHADFQCDRCDKKFYGKRAYQKHLKEHDNPSSEEVFKCTKCNYKHKNKGYLDTHMKKHQIIFICSICEDVFTAKDNLHAHLNEKHGVNAEENPYPCPLCRAPNAFLKQLNDHIHLEHKVLKDHQCQTCEKLFTTKAILTMHMMEQHEFDAEAGSMSNNISISAALKLAEVEVHEDEFEAVRKIKCKECGAMVKSQRVLEGHMRQKHQPWTHNLFCHLCPWSTYEKYKMKKHMEEKHQTTTFYCDQCDFKSFRRNQLSKHKRTIHLNIKSKQCPDCDESFCSKAVLAKHMWGQHKKVYKYTDSKKRLKEKRRLNQ